MKTLISWMAYAEDFSADGRQINPEGPHMKFYVHHMAQLGCAKHIVLWNSADSTALGKIELLQNSLKAQLVRFDVRPRLEVHQIDIDDPWNVEEIFQRLEGYLLQQANEEFVAMINTGTRDMQTVWYLLAARYPKQLELLKVKHPKYSDNKEAGDLEKGVKLSEGILPAAFAVRGAVLAESVHFMDFQLEARQRAMEIAASPDTTVLILGEHGTGKESLAKTVHEHSIRRNRPYEVRNCAGYTDELLRSELFGHKKGAFTGADRDKKGLFETAKGGTVFLDEIGDISPFMQMSLLRVLQNKEIVPVGAQEPVRIDVRIVAATNKDLHQACQEGRFRWDLFYRLSVAEIHTRAVRDFPLELKRKAIQYFIDHAYEEKFRRIGKKRITLSKETKAILDAYDFPGNVREMENLIESLYTYPSERIAPEWLPQRLMRLHKELDERMESAKIRHAMRIYKKYGQNKAKALEVLQISINTLNGYLEKAVELHE